MNTKINYKTKILFIVTKSEFGGAQRFLYELTNKLNSLEYEISISAGPEGNWTLLKMLEERGFKTFKLKYLKRKVNPFCDLMGLLELILLINRFEPNFVHLNSSKAGILGSLACQILKILKPDKFKNTKVIYRIGGWSFNDPSFGWKRKIWLLAEKITARFKDIIVTVSKKDEIQAKKLGIKPREKIKTIYNGVDIDILEKNFLERKKARLILEKEIIKGMIFNSNFVVGAIANFYPSKGVKYLIEGGKFFLENNPEFENKVIFLIIGDGMERKSIEELIKINNLENKFILLGEIINAYQYLKAFDVFVLPSIKEGFPWVILEAMAAALPIIATSVGALPEIIKNKKNGILIDPANPEQIAESIKEILENKILRERLSYNAYQTISKKFSLTKMVEETKALFR